MSPVVFRPCIVALLLGAAGVAQGLSLTARKAEAVSSSWFHGGPPSTSDVESYLDNINNSLDRVNEVLSTANDTAFELVNDFLTSIGSFQDLLTSLQTAADAAASVPGGEDIADQAAKLINAANKTLGAAETKVPATVDKVSAKLAAIMPKLYETANKVSSQFLDAYTLIQEKLYNMTSDDASMYKTEDSDVEAEETEKKHDRSLGETDEEAKQNDDEEGEVAEEATANTEAQMHAGKQGDEESKAMNHQKAKHTQASGQEHVEEEASHHQKASHAHASKPRHEETQAVNASTAHEEAGAVNAQNTTRVHAGKQEHEKSKASSHPTAMYAHAGKQDHKEAKVVNQSLATHVHASKQGHKESQGANHFMTTHAHAGKQGRKETQGVVHSTSTHAHAGKQGHKDTQRVVHSMTTHAHAGKQVHGAAHRVNHSMATHAHAGKLGLKTAKVVVDKAALHEQKALKKADKRKQNASASQALAFEKVHPAEMTFEEKMAKFSEAYPNAWFDADILRKHFTKEEVKAMIHKGLFAVRQKPGDQMELEYSIKTIPQASQQNNVTKKKAITLLQARAFQTQGVAAAVDVDRALAAKGSTNPCAKATKEIRKANATLSKLSEMVGEVNSTVAGLFGAPVEAAMMAIDTINSTVAPAIEGLPSNLAQPVSKGLDTILSVKESLSGDVVSELSTYESMIVDAVGMLADISPLAETLQASVDEACLQGACGPAEQKKCEAIAAASR